MRNLHRYLPPFASDISGAAAVLFELGGLTVICDAGEYTGNTCGFDEPRWHYGQKSAIFSAGMRDTGAAADAEERLLDKTGEAQEMQRADFIAFLGTPLPAAARIDFLSLCEMAEKRFRVPAIYVDTNGMDHYDEGEQKAYEAVLTMLQRGEEGASDPAVHLVQQLKKRLEKKCGISPESLGETQPFLGVWGATPLELPARDSVSALKERSYEHGYVYPLTYGMGTGLEEFLLAGRTRKNLAVSPSGVMIAGILQERYGTPYRVGFAFPRNGRSVFREEGIRRREHAILIVHQQIFADGIREYMDDEREGVDVATFFMMNDREKMEQDVRLEGEEDFIRLVRKNRYEMIVGDPLLKRALDGYRGKFVGLPHYAVSGQLCYPESRRKLMEQVDSAIWN